MVPAEEVNHVNEQSDVSAQLVIAWKIAICADIGQEPIKVDSSHGDDMRTMETIHSNEEGMQHTLAFLQKHPYFSVKVTEALHSTLHNASLRLTQLLLEYNANPNSEQVQFSPLYTLNVQLHAFRFDTGESASCLLDDYFKGQMELGRLRLELLLCYGYRPSVQDIKKIYEHYRLDSFDPIKDLMQTQDESPNNSTGENNRNGTGILQNASKLLETIPFLGIGIKLLKSGVESARQKQRARVPEPLYDARQFITPLELSSRLSAAIKDIEEREKSMVTIATSNISEGMGIPTRFLTGLVYQYSNIEMEVRRQIYERRKAEGTTIAFRYTLR